MAAGVGCNENSWCPFYDFGGSANLIRMPRLRDGATITHWPRGPLVIHPECESSAVDDLPSELVTEEPDHRVELLHRNISRYGTIYNTLAAACDVSGEVIAVRPA